MAYHIRELVSGLCVYPYGGKQMRQGASFLKPCGGLAFDRDLARERRQLCDLGRGAGCVDNRGKVCLRKISG